MSWGQRAMAVWQQSIRTYRGLPARTRYLLMTATVVIGLAVTYTYFSGGASTMNFVLRHSFRSAHVAVRVDGSEVVSDDVSGSALKKLMVWDKRGATHSKAVRVRPGRHVVEVEVTAPGYHQVKSIYASVSRGGEVTVSASAVGGELVLSARAATNEAAGSPMSILGMATPLLLTICGSAMSAVIGFFVQEFLRARKAKIAVRS